MAISIGKVRNGSYSKHLADTEKSGAAEYYKGEDVPSSWSGRGAEMQGLRGDVREEDLHAQLAGRVVDSGGARDMHAENPRRTEGFDLTVSAPKSVSIEALARDNKDALDAHREANREVLAELEKVAKARFTEAGKTRAEDTGNITVASYEHHGSVSGDPHLHTHNAVANLTFDAEGRARALDSREIYANVDRLREVYDSALEKALNGRGLATYRDEKGHTQLEGYTREAMREFSSRSDQMDKHLAASGREAASAKERELARQETRRGQAHEPRSREETVQAWQEKVEQTRGAGPAVSLQEKPKEQSCAAEKPEKNGWRPTNEFKDAKWTVNAEKDARAKLETGAYRSEAHREELERRIERAEALRDNKQTHDLYLRAEKAVEKMGVHDPDAKQEARTRERMERSADKQERGAKEEWAKAARTVNDMKDAQAKLRDGVFDSEKHKEKLEERVAAGEKLKAEKPDLFNRAEKSVEQRGVRDPDAFEKALAQAKADWQTLKDADLAAKALKSDADQASGFGRKELSASDKQRMDVAFNSRGDKFYVDSAGNFYADKLQGRGKPEETYLKDALRDDLRKDVERAAAAFAERPQEMAQRREQYEAWKIEQAKTREAEAYRREDSSKGTELQVASRVGSAALDQAAETGKLVAEVVNKQTPEEAAKAAAEAREKARVEQMREQGQEGIKDLVRQQATIESTGEATGAGGDPDTGRRQQEQEREQNKQIAQEQRGQDAYTRKEGDDAVLERREQRAQEDRTATAGGTASTGKEPGQEERTAAAGGGAATGKEPAQRQPAESQRIQDMRERADLLAESVIRRDGASSADGKEARDFDARKATLDELSAFLEKHGSPAQKEDARFELMKRDQGRQSDEHRQNREKADREARERSEGKSFGSSYL